MTENEVENLRQKVQVYETFLHLLQMHAVTMDRKKVSRLISNACDWSYAHRCGNGAYTDDEQAAIVRRALGRLIETG